MGTARRLLFVALFFVAVAAPTYAYISLVSLAHDAYYGPICTRACEASSLRYERLARGRGPSVTGCLCTDGGVSTKVEPRFYVDVPVVDGLVGMLVLCVEVAGLFAFVYAPFGVWRFLASRRSSAVPAGNKE